MILPAHRFVRSTSFPMGLLGEVDLNISGCPLVSPETMVNGLRMSSVLA